MVSISVIHLARTLVFSFLGIASDIWMVKFLKKRNSNVGPGEAQLVPWKSSEEKADITVPVVATVAALVCDFISILTVWFFSSILQENKEYSISIFYLELYLLTTIQMPVVLGLTLRVALKKKPAPKIPHKLNFHGDDESSVVDDDNMDQIQDVPNEVGNQEVDSINNDEHQDDEAAANIDVEVAVEDPNRLNLDDEKESTKKAGVASAELQTKNDLSTDCTESEKTTFGIQSDGEITLEIDDDHSKSKVIFVKSKD